MSHFAQCLGQTEDSSLIQLHKIVLLSVFLPRQTNPGHLLSDATVKMSTGFLKDTTKQGGAGSAPSETKQLNNLHFQELWPKYCFSFQPVESSLWLPLCPMWINKSSLSFQFSGSGCCWGFFPIHFLATAPSLWYEDFS